MPTGSQLNLIYDADNAFRAPESAALTAAGSAGSLKLDKMDKARGARRDQLGADVYHVAVRIEDADFVTTVVTTEIREAYTVELRVGPAGSATTVVASFDVEDPNPYLGYRILHLDAKTIELLDADRVEIDLYVAMVGDAPSIKLHAWLV